MFKIILILILLIKLCFDLDLDFGLGLEIEKYIDNKPVSFPMEDEILILTEYTIDEAIKTTPNLAILFYAPWCPHCQELYPEIINLANMTEIKNMNLSFAKINLDYYRGISQKYSINSFPTLMLFSNGEPKDIYLGGSNKNDIKEWFRKKLVSLTYSISTQKELKNFLTKKKHTFVYFGKNEKNIKKYLNYIEHEEYGLKYGICNNEELLNKYNKEIPFESLILFTPFKEQEYIIINEINKDKINEEYQNNRYPLIFENIKTPSQMLYYTGVPVLYFFRDELDKNLTKKYDENFLKLSKIYKNKLYFWKGDYKDKTVKRFIKEANLTKLNRSTHTPEGTIFDLKKGFNKWRSEDYYDEFSIENFNKFVEMYIKGKMIPPPLSEEPVLNQDNPVYQLVNKTFENDVINNNLNVFVKFYSPNCPHCKRLAPTYIELANKLKDKKNIRIAEINILKNDFELFNINGYPSLFLFQNGNKDKPIEYKGDRTLDDLIEFILKNIK